ncbi:recombinase family protein [Glutamicibacter sp. 287]|uniref:recombinase family protein n=1 Tax=Glutamicibacter sp. 287 TaxID=3457732 RepID=UPI0040345083
MKASIYARLSQDKRKGSAEEGSSVQAQVEACKAFIAAKGWTLDKTYVDNDISATSGAVRPQFEQMLKDSPANVVAFKSDRISRDVMDTLRLKASGVTGWLCDGGKLDFSSSDSTMLTLFRSVIDSTEQTKKSERQKLATLRDAKAGKYRGSIRPFGQDRTGAWVEPEASAVREATGKLLSGEWTFFKVATEWNARGLLTPQTGKQGGREWTSGTVSQYFKRPRLKGYQEYEGTLYPLADWKPLLNEEEFEHIQLIRDSRKTGVRGKQGYRHKPHLLSGFIECGVCGRKLNASYRGKPTNTRAYSCPTPRHLSRAAEPIEKMLVSRLLVPLFTPSASSVLEPHGAEEANKLRKELLELTKAHREWLDEAVEAGMRPALIVARESKHEAGIADLKARLAELEADSVFAGIDWVTHVQETDDFASFEPIALAKWAELTTDRQRALIQALYASVRVQKQGVGTGTRFKPEHVLVEPTPLLLELEKAAHQWMSYSIMKSLFG